MESAGFDCSSNICIVFRGELLRNSKSRYHANIKNNKQLREYDLSEDSINRQNDIMKSIINHIIIPYEILGFNIFVSGCLYECNDYNKNLKDFFPNHSIKIIKQGDTNQAELFNLSLDHAEKENPNCIEYISLRADFIMLKNISIKNTFTGSYVGFAWENKSKYPSVDAFFIISKNAMNTFKKILKKIGEGKLFTHTHDIVSGLKYKTKIYPIWDNYKNKATGIPYNEYIKNIKLHKYRPIVNYMRDR